MLPTRESQCPNGSCPHCETSPTDKCVFSTNRSRRLARNNNTVHLFKLSEEILIIILQFAGLVSLSVHENISVTQAVARVMSLGSLMMVCTRLHRMILGYFRFWTVIPFISSRSKSSLRAFKFMVMQYASKDIHLVLDWTGMADSHDRDPLQALFRGMKSEWNRVRCISIRDSCGPKEKNTIELLLSNMPVHMMARVDTLRFECGRTSLSIPHFPHLPNLASLTIKAPDFYVQLNMEVSCGFPSSLTTLSHLRVDVPIPLHTLTGFLAQCRSLISFEWFVPGNSTKLAEDIWTEPIALLTLETLDVIHPQHFPVLRAPRLVCATFDVHMSIPRLRAYPGLYGRAPDMANLRQMTVCICTINRATLEQLLGTCTVLESLTLRLVSSAPFLKDALDAVRRGAHPLLRNLRIGILPRDEWLSRSKMIGFSTSVRALLTAIPYLMLECTVFYHDSPSWLHQLSIEFTSRMSLVHVHESDADHNRRAWCPQRRFL